MIRVPFRAVLLSLIALVAIGGLIVSNKPSSQKTGTLDFKTGACKEFGTTVVIDFGSESTKPPIVNCVNNLTNGETSGWQLLKAAGLAIEGTSEYPESFVCRINNIPNTSSEDCLGTPSPLNGTWSYFYSTASQDDQRKTAWTRSPVGAATRKPDCGDYEGWLFAKSTSSQSALNLVPRLAPSAFICQ